MKRVALLIIGFIVFIFSSVSFAEEKTEVVKPERSWFTATFRGGFWIPEDSTFREFYGKWSNDMYYLEFGVYPLRNIMVGAAIGGYYQHAHAIGLTTGEQSEDDLYLTLVPVEAIAGFRLRFKDSQIIVPFATGAYDWVYYHEDADPGGYVDGWKSGPAAYGGLLILLDKADPDAANNLKRNYGVEHTYFEMSARYSFVGEDDELDLRGWTYMIGINFDF